MNKFNLKFKNLIQSMITTVNGVQQLSKGCQIATPFGSTCCTTNFCNNEIIQPPIEATTTLAPMTLPPSQLLQCYTCISCGYNNIGGVQACLSGYSCCVRTNV